MSAGSRGDRHAVLSPIIRPYPPSLSLSVPSVRCSATTTRSITTRKKYAAVTQASSGRRDLEGVVAKWSHGTYHCDGRGTSWLKIKNPHYSQMEGRRELFEARRDRHQRKRHTAAPELRL